VEARGIAPPGTNSQGRSRTEPPPSKRGPFRVSAREGPSYYPQAAPGGSLSGVRNARVWSMPERKTRPQKSGPKADRLILPGPWEDAFGKAIRKARPAGGWPKRPTRTAKAKRPKPTS